MKFATILADPPWQFKNYSKAGEDRNAGQHYDLMTLKQIQELPVKDVAADDCVLLMWATGPLLPLQISVMERWGFSYKTIGFSWMKGCKNGAVFMGNGYWSRSNVELCLLGTRGKPKRISAAVRQAIYAVPGRHSEKPVEIHERVERLCSGPYLELFARQAGRPGWVQLGNEITGNSIDRDLIELADQKVLGF
jgi:N6-adenosine-specific RNA methylase IME4